MSTRETPPTKPEAGAAARRSRARRRCHRRPQAGGRTTTTAPSAAPTTPRRRSTAAAGLKLCAGNNYVDDREHQEAELNYDADANAERAEELNRELPSLTVVHLAPDLFDVMSKPNREPACVFSPRPQRLPASPCHRREPHGSSEDSDDFVDVVFDYVKKEEDFAPVLELSGDNYSFVGCCFGGLRASLKDAYGEDRR